MDNLLDILHGRSSPPTTRFLSAKGAISTNDWLSLLEALRKPTGVVLGLRLQGCGLTDTHARQLAEALATHPVLEVLELPDNGIGEEGLKCLVGTLQLGNMQIKSIDLSGNPCTSAADLVAELETLLRRNRVIKKLPRTPDSKRTGAGPAPGLFKDGPGTSPASAAVVDGPLPGGHTPRASRNLNISLAEVGIGPIGMDAAAFEVERRLQHLEEAESTIRSELQHVRSFSTQSEVWQRKIDAAGQQIAAILALVDGRNLTLEGRLGSMERWRDGAEDAWAKQSQVLDDMTSQLGRMEASVCALRERMAKAEAAVAQAEAAAVAQAEAAVCRCSSTRDAATETEPPAANPAPPLETAGIQELWSALQELSVRLVQLEGTSGGKEDRAPLGARAAGHPALSTEVSFGQHEEPASPGPQSSPGAGPVQGTQHPHAAVGSSLLGAAHVHSFDSVLGSGPLQGGRPGGLVLPLDVPSSPVMWRNACVAMSPSSCAPSNATTPTRDSGVTMGQLGSSMADTLRASMLRGSNTLFAAKATDTALEMAAAATAVAPGTWQHPASRSGNGVAAQTTKEDDDQQPSSPLPERVSIFGGVNAPGMLGARTPASAGPADSGSVLLYPPSTGGARRPGASPSLRYTMARLDSADSCEYTSPAADASPVPAEPPSVQRHVPRCFTATSDTSGAVGLEEQLERMSLSWRLSASTLDPALGEAGTPRSARPDPAPVGVGDTTPCSLAVGQPAAQREAQRSSQLLVGDGSGRPSSTVVVRDEGYVERSGEGTGGSSPRDRRPSCSSIARDSDLRADQGAGPQVADCVPNCSSAVKGGPAARSGVGPAAPGAHAHGKAALPLQTTFSTPQLGGAPAAGAQPAVVSKPGISRAHGGQQAGSVAGAAGKRAEATASGSALAKAIPSRLLKPFKHPPAQGQAVLRSPGNAGGGNGLAPGQVQAVRASQPAPAGTDLAQPTVHRARRPDGRYLGTATAAATGTATAALAAGAGRVGKGGAGCDGAVEVQLDSDTQGVSEGTAGRDQGAGTDAQHARGKAAAVLRGAGAQQPAAQRSARPGKRWM